MKWQVVGLVVLGLVAAVCASVLVGGTRVDTLTGPAPETNPRDVRRIVECRGPAARGLRLTRKGADWIAARRGLAQEVCSVK